MNPLAKIFTPSSSPGLPSSRTPSPTPEIPPVRRNSRLQALFIDRGVIDSKGNLTPQYRNTPLPKLSFAFRQQIVALNKGKIIGDNAKSPTVEQFVLQMRGSSNIELIGGYLRKLLLQDGETLNNFFESLGINSDIPVEPIVSVPDCDIRCTIQEKDDDFFASACPFLKTYVENYLGKPLTDELVKFKPVHFDGINHFGVITFKGDENFNYEFVIVNNINRDWLFRHDALRLTMNGTYNLVSDFGIAPLIDLITRTIHVPSPETVEQKGWPRLISYYTQGWTLGETKDTEKLLFDLSKKHYNINTLLKDTLNNHHFGNQEAGVAIYINAYAASQDPSLECPAIESDNLLGAVSELIREEPIDLVFSCLQTVALVHAMVSNASLVNHCNEISIQVKVGDYFLLLPFEYKESLIKVISAGHIINKLLDVWPLEINYDKPSQLDEELLDYEFLRSIPSTHPLSIYILGLCQLAKPELDLRGEMIRKNPVPFPLLEFLYPESRSIFEEARASRGWIHVLAKSKDPILSQKAIEIYMEGRRSKDEDIRMARASLANERPQYALTLLQGHPLKGDEIDLLFRAISREEFVSAEIRLKSILEKNYKAYLPSFLRFIEAISSPRLVLTSLKILQQKKAKLTPGIIKKLNSNCVSLCKILRDSNLYREVYEFISILISFQVSVKDTGEDFLWSLEEFTKPPKELKKVSQAFTLLKHLEKPPESLARVLNTYGVALEPAKGAEFFMKEAPEIYGEKCLRVFEQSVTAICSKMLHRPQTCLDLINKYKLTDCTLWYSVIVTLSTSTDKKIKQLALPTLFRAEENNISSPSLEERRVIWMSSLTTANVLNTKSFYELVDQLIGNKLFKEVLKEDQQFLMLSALFKELVRKISTSPYSQELAQRLVRLRREIVSLKYDEEVTFIVLELLISWGNKFSKSDIFGLANELMDHRGPLSDRNRIFIIILGAIRLYAPSYAERVGHFNITGKMDPNLKEFIHKTDLLVRSSCNIPSDLVPTVMIELFPFLVDYEHPLTYDILHLDGLRNFIGEANYFYIWAYYIRKQINTMMLAPKPNYSEIITFFLNHEMFMLTNSINKYNAYFQACDALAHYIAYEETDDELITNVLKLVRPSDDLFYEFLERLIHTRPEGKDKVDNVCSYLVVAILQNPARFFNLIESFIYWQMEFKTLDYEVHMNHVKNLLRNLADSRSILDDYIIGWILVYNLPPLDYVSEERYNESLACASSYALQLLFKFDSEDFPNYVKLIKNMQQTPLTKIRKLSIITSYTGLFLALEDVHMSAELKELLDSNLNEFFDMAGPSKECGKLKAKWKKLYG